MAKRKRWTSTEDTQVVDQVRKSPTNLKQAFKEAARVTGRSELTGKIAQALHVLTIYSQEF